MKQPKDKNKHKVNEKCLDQSVEGTEHDFDEEELQEDMLQNITGGKMSSTIKEAAVRGASRGVGYEVTGEAIAKWKGL